MHAVAMSLVGLGLALTLANWLCLVQSLMGKRHVSPVFPASSLMTAAGLALFDKTRSFWWVGLLTDYTLPILLVSAPRLLADEWNTSRFTQIVLLRAVNPPRTVQLSLHKRGHFLLQASFDPPAPCNDHGACVETYSIVGTWKLLSESQWQLRGYNGDRILNVTLTPAGYVCREEHYPSSEPFPYDSLDGLVLHKAEV